MSADPCLPPAGDSVPASTPHHHHVSHHVVGRRTRHLRRGSSPATTHPHLVDGCGKHFEAGKPGVLAARPADGAAPAVARHAVRVSGASKGLAGVLGAAAIAGAAALGVPGAAPTGVAGLGGGGGQAVVSAPAPGGDGAVTPPAVMSTPPGVTSRPPGSTSGAPAGGPTLIPEPASAALFIGAAGLAFVIRLLVKKRKPAVFSYI